MMSKKLGVGISMLGTTLVLGIGGASIWRFHSSFARPAVAGGSILLSTTPISQVNTISSASEDSKTSNLSPAGSSGAAVSQSNSATANTQTQRASANPIATPVPSEPSPSEFKQYDQYLTSPSALFGDVVYGTGGVASLGKKVAVSYKGWLTTGQLFDQSVAEKPFVFDLGSHQVVIGWEEGIGGMKVGGKRLIIVPPAVGYGSQGHGPVPGNAVMVFEINLLAVQ